MGINKGNLLFERKTLQKKHFKLKHISLVLSFILLEIFRKVVDGFKMRRLVEFGLVSQFRFRIQDPFANFLSVHNLVSYAISSRIPLAT